MCRILRRLKKRPLPDQAENIANQESSLAKIKQILEDAEGKDLFKDIEDPSRWQSELRKEWDRDF